MAVYASHLEINLPKCLTSCSELSFFIFWVFVFHILIFLLCVSWTGMLFEPTRSSIINEPPIAHPPYAKQLHPMYCFRWSASKLQVLFLCTERWGNCLLPCRVYRQHSISKGTAQNQGRWWDCCWGILDFVSVGLVQIWAFLTLSIFCLSDSLVHGFSALSTVSGPVRVNLSSIHFITKILENEMKNCRLRA